MSKIEITVSPNGEITVETRGFRGKGCRAASKFIEEALGTKLTDKSTPEAFLGEEKNSCQKSTS